MWADSHDGVIRSRCPAFGNLESEQAVQANKADFLDAFVPSVTKTLNGVDGVDGVIGVGPDGSYRAGGLTMVARIRP